jgi:hypothetical protein
MEAKVAKSSISLFLKRRSDNVKFFSTLAPGTKGRSDLFTKSDRERRICDEVGTMIDKVSNDGWLPNS